VTNPFPRSSSRATLVDVKSSPDDGADVPPEVVARIRAVCLALPEAYEEHAWVGTRWRVRTRTFAHVLLIDAGWPPAYVRAAGTEGPAVVLMFRSSGPELDVLRGAGPPFFGPPWRADEVGMAIGDGTVDWDEIAELITESYCVVAPKRLAGAVNRPSEVDGRPSEVDGRPSE
jgi:YjbR